MPDDLKGSENASAVSEPYWEALRNGEFSLQHCNDCGRRQHYPRVVCRWCGSDRLGWAPASTHAVIIAGVLSHRSSKAYLEDNLPYALALVALDEGPTMMARMEGGELRRGTRVHIDLPATRQSGLLTVAPSPPGSES